jgi:hypothetical protein
MKKLLVLPLILLAAGACVRSEERVVQPVAQRPPVIERERVIERQGSDRPVDVHIYDNR